MLGSRIRAPAKSPPLINFLHKNKKNSEVFYFNHTTPAVKYEWFNLNNKWKHIGPTVEEYLQSIGYYERNKETNKSTAC